MRAMLVTAGFGTRLAPLTDLLPKPAVPVANFPLAWFALDHLRRAGFHDFVLNTHHLAAELERELRAVAPNDVTLSFVHEPQILGTGGGVKHAWRAFRDEPLLSMNGKLIFAPHIAEAIRKHEATSAIATMIVCPMPSGNQFSAIELDADQRVRAITRKPSAGNSTDNDTLQRTMYTGIQLLHPRAFADLPDDGDIIEHSYQRWLARGEHVQAHVESTPFHDAGISPKHYFDTNQALLTGKLTWPGITPDAQQNLIANSAQVPASTTLSQTVVGPNAQLAPNLKLESCIIWPNTKVTASATSTIILPTGQRLQL